MSEGMAIARIWRGTVPTERADEYAEYLHESGLKAIQQTPGNLGVFLLRREEGEETHFQTAEHNTVAMSSFFAA